jgi:hypothetical protein
MDATAWTPRLLTTFFVLSAYTILGRSNPQSLAFLPLVMRKDWRAFPRQILSYSLLRPVWLAALVYQIALYDYPPYALLLTVFPVIAIFFSQAPRIYRTLVALRDVAFVVAGLALYSLSTAVIYLPFVRFFTREGTGDLNAYGNKFVASLYAAYQFRYNTDISSVLGRLGHLLIVSGDLWFLPQIRIHILTGITLLIAFVFANSGWLFQSRSAQIHAWVDSDGLARLRIGSWTSDGVVAIGVLAICFVMSAAPIWGSAGGFIEYRTSVAPTALMAITFVFAARSVAVGLSRLVGCSRNFAVRVADAALILTVCVAAAANFDANYMDMKLGRNELAYFTEIVRHAIDNKSKTIMLIDPRPSNIDMSSVYDQRGNAVPPYELGCFASYCMQTGAIVRVVAAQMGLSYDTFNVLVPRGNEPVPGLTCAMVTGPIPSYPPGASARSIGIINYYRTLAPLTCVMVSMKWHDLGVDLSRKGDHGS